MLQAARSVVDVLGRKWFVKRIEQEKAARLSFQQRSKDRRHNYIYRPVPHPLVCWILDFERMREEAVETNFLRINQNSMRLILLGQCLARVKDLPGFDKFIPRLRGEESFFPAAFEIETAAAHVSAGNHVEFVREKAGERTPDLKVTPPSGVIFWVECKCREGLNERDQKIAKFWVKLEQHLLRVFGPNKICAMVIVKALRDPVDGDLHPLLAQIFAAVEMGGLGELNPTTGLHLPVEVLHGHYELIVQILASPDEDVAGDGLELLGIRRDRVTMLMEMKTDENQRNRIRNPIILGFQNHRPMDKVKGLVGVFKNAADQIPKGGPGVVCIRVPDDFWMDDFDRYMDEAIQSLKKELCGDINRRINVVFVKSIMYQSLRDGEKTGLAGVPMSVSVEHDNPYFKVDRDV